MIDKKNKDKERRYSNSDQQTNQNSCNHSRPINDRIKTCNKNTYSKSCEYDDKGRLIREITYGKDGQISSGRNRWAIIEYTYDENGNKTTSWYGANGNLYKRK